MNAVTVRRAPPRRATAKLRKPEPVAMVRLPLAAGRLRRHVAIGFVVVLMAAAIVVAILLGLPQRWWIATAAAASRAGFEVRHVEVTGVANSPRLGVITTTLEGPTNSMLLVDLAAARARLRALPWVADASVARRLPDTLIVAVVERRPVALWQFRHRLAAVDRNGVPITADRLDRFASLPLVVGAGANRHVDDLLALLADHPRLAAGVDAATFVGRRRWDLRFKTGEALALPEGTAADAALARFDALDRKDGLLGKGYARFDLRLPGQMTVKLAAPVPLPPRPGAKPVAPKAPPRAAPAPATAKAIVI